ncbi:ScbR family autoregulator-binding transcription factor [Streptomyces achromogenes]|uniref:ScbR family autoregulator-binding transcription factor n=1 Tax=Streptomyces achromogenes TaxID=67255 RepID=UPI0036A86AEA
MARQERGIRSRRLILEAAAHVFDERGYDAASTNEILARADLTRGALYHHFPSKEAIATALIEAHGQALVVPHQEVVLQAVIDLTLGFARQLQHDPILRASVRLAVEQSSFAPPTNTPYQQSITAIEDLLRRAGQQGELLPGTNLPEVAQTIVGSFTGLQVMSQIYSDRQDLPERVSALWRLILPGLASPGILPRLRTTAPPPADDSRQDG